MHGSEAKIGLIVIVTSSAVKPHSVQLLKKLINPKENFFHVDNANEKFTTYGLVYKQFHHGPGFDCLYLISKGLFKNSLRETNKKKCLITAILNFLIQ